MTEKTFTVNLNKEQFIVIKAKEAVLVDNTYLAFIEKGGGVNAMFAPGHWTHYVQVEAVAE
jgi:hypothetical protein